MFSNSGGGKNIRILGNRIHHIGAGVYDSTPYGLIGVYTDSGAANWTINGNVIHDNGRAAVLTGSHDHGLYLHGSNMDVTNNVFYNTPNGWHIQTAAGFSGTIVNNTFYGSNMYPGKLGAMTLRDPNSNVIVRNNIFYDPSAMRSSLTLSMSGYCYIDNNIVYKPSGAGLMDSMPSNCVQSNRLGVDPRLVNPSSELRLSPDLGEPAINAGSASAAPPADFDGAARPRARATISAPSSSAARRLRRGHHRTRRQRRRGLGRRAERRDDQLDHERSRGYPGRIRPDRAYGASTVLNAALRRITAPS